MLGAAGSQPFHNRWIRLCWATAAVDPPVANARKGEWRTSHYIFVAIETITGQLLAQGLQIGCIALLSGEFHRQVLSSLCFQEAKETLSAPPAFASLREGVV